MIQNARERATCVHRTYGIRREPNKVNPYQIQNCIPNCLTEVADPSNLGSIIAKGHVDWIWITDLNCVSVTQTTVRNQYRSQHSHR